MSLATAATSTANITSTMPQLSSDMIRSAPSPQPPPPLPTTPITSGDLSMRAAPANPVHLVWDFDTVAFPNAPAADVYQRLANMTRQYGQLRTFDVAYHRTITAAAAPRFEAAIETLRSFGATIHRTPHTVDVWVVTWLLQLALNVQMSLLTGASRPVVIIVTSNAAVASALALVSQNQLFSEVVLCHTSAADQSLTRSCTLAINFDVMNHVANKHAPLFLDTFERREGEEEPQYGRGDIAGYMSGFSGESETATRPHFSTEDDDDMAALTHHIDTLRSQSPSPVSSTSSSYSAPHSFGTVPFATFDTHLHDRQTYNGHALSREWENTASPPPPMHAAQIPQHNYPRSGDYQSQPQPPLPADYGRFAGEHEFTYSQSVRQSAPQRYGLTSTAGGSKGRKGNTSGPGVMSGAPHPQTVSAGRARTCVQAFQKVIAYCEQEKIIPRESVVKKRLLDSKIGIELDFEELVLAVREYGAGVIEGEPPQRIIWPRGPNNEARKFPCVDFLTPRSRLSSDQMNELFKFLLHFQPEVDRGRFGFAQYLGRHGPLSIRTLPHGILVELVQLLLNQKVLLFRKGRVSVSPALLTDPSLLQLALAGQPTAAATAAAGVNVTTPITSANASPMSSPPPEKEFWPVSAPSTPPGHNVRTIRPSAWTNSSPSTTSSAAQLQRSQQSFVPPASPPPMTAAPQQTARRFGGLDPNQPAFVSMFESSASTNDPESDLHTDGGDVDRPNALPPLHNRIVAEWKQFIGRPRGSSLPPRPDPLNYTSANGHHSTPSSPVPLPQSGTDSPVPIKYNIYRRNSTGGSTDAYSGSTQSTTAVSAVPAILPPSYADAFMHSKTERAPLAVKNEDNAVSEESAAVTAVSTESASTAQSPSMQPTPVVTSDKMMSRSLPTAISSCLPTDGTSSPDSASLKLGPALLSAIHPSADDARDNRSSNMSILSAMKAPVTPGSADAASLFTFAFQQRMINKQPPSIHESTNDEHNGAAHDSGNANSDDNTPNSAPNRVVGRARAYSFD